jgi:hypothetical protein
MIRPPEILVEIEQVRSTLARLFAPLRTRGELLPSPVIVLAARLTGGREAAAQQPGLAAQDLDGPTLEAGVIDKDGPQGRLRPFWSHA